MIAWAPGTRRDSFSFDDREMLESPIIQGTRSWTAAFLGDAWEHRGNAGHWRPAATLSLRRDRAAYGDGPSAFARSNLALHLFVLLLATVCWRGLCFGRHLAMGRLKIGLWRGGVLGLAIFGAHPVLADSVAWISGRTSMLSAAGGLLGLLGMRVATRGRPRAGLAFAASAAGLSLALMGKEDGLAFAPAYLLLAVFGGRRLLAASAAGILFTCVSWVLLRQEVLGTPFQPLAHSPLAGHDLGQRLRIGCSAAFELLRICAWPTGYPPAWRATAFLPNSTDGLAPSIAGAALLAGLGAVVIWGLGTRGQTRLPLGSAAIALCALIPVLQIVPLGEVAAPRFLYLPLLFAAPLLGYGLRQIIRGRGAWLVLLPLVIASQQRSQIYASRLAYWEARLPSEADQPQAWNALGNAYLELGERDQARSAFEQATAIDPDYSRPWTGLAILALETGALLEAEEHLMRALATGPSNPIAWSNAGALWLRTEAWEAADQAYTKATVLAPGRAAAWRGLARAKRAQGLDSEAAAALAEAERLDPSTQRAQP